MKVKDNSNVTIGVWRDYYKQPDSPPLIDLAEKIVRCYDEFVESQAKSRKKTAKKPTRKKGSQDIALNIREAMKNAAAEAVKKSESVFVDLKKKLASRPKEWATTNDRIPLRALHYLIPIFPLIKKKEITFDQSSHDSCSINSAVGHARGILELARLLEPYENWKEHNLFEKELAYAEESASKKRNRNILSRLHEWNQSEEEIFWALDDNDLLLHEDKYQNAVTEKDAFFAGEDNEIIPLKEELNYTRSVPCRALMLDGFRIHNETIRVIPERIKIRLDCAQIFCIIPRYMKVGWARQFPGDVITHIRTREDLLRDDIQSIRRASSGEVDRVELQKRYDELMLGVKYGEKKHVYEKIKKEFFPYVCGPEASADEVSREMLRQLKMHEIIRV